MIISSHKKQISNVRIHEIEQKDYIKYLGVYIDKHLKWGQQINHIKSKISKNTGILNKLRYYVNLQMLKQLYYSLIYPYLNYGIMSWGNTYILPIYPKFALLKINVYETFSLRIKEKMPVPTSIYWEYSTLTMFLN